jgi:hypothetical protein
MRFVYHHGIDLAITQSQGVRGYSFLMQQTYDRWAIAFRGMKLQKISMQLSP